MRCASPAAPGDAQSWLTPPAWLTKPEVAVPWKESSVVDERLRFVGRLLEGEEMTVMCREFGISRKTGYKIFGRYKEHGLESAYFVGNLFTQIGSPWPG